VCQLIPLQVKGDFLAVLPLYSMHISSHSAKTLLLHQVITVNG